MGLRAGGVVRVLVCNRSDVASVNIRDRLLETGEWEQAGKSFRGSPVWARSETVMVEIAGPAVTDEALDADLKATGWPVMDVWFLSKHAAASGQPSLTVHPIGNHDAAKFGGRPETLSPASSRDMGALLRRLKEHAAKHGLPHAVTYESTHHGPHMSAPSLFVEIGSDAAWYADRAGAQVVAAAVNDVLAGEGRCSGPVLVGVGGGHYVPRHTDKALAGWADFGHFLPSHFVTAETPVDRLRKAIEATPDCAGVYVHRKGLKGAQRQQVLSWCQELQIKVWSQSDEDIDSAAE
jgi:D-aminoacyl-tRNA deacylase